MQFSKVMSLLQMLLNVVVLHYWRNHSTIIEQKLLLGLNSEKKCNYEKLLYKVWLRPKHFIADNIFMFFCKASMTYSSDIKHL